jgi:hypothetical protein
MRSNCIFLKVTNFFIVKMLGYDKLLNVNKSKEDDEDDD